MNVRSAIGFAFLLVLSGYPALAQSAMPASQSMAAAKTIPSNAKVHAMTSDDMQKYDAAALANSTAIVAPIVRANQLNLDQVLGPQGISSPHVAAQPTLLSQPMLQNSNQPPHTLLNSPNPNQPVSTPSHTTSPQPLRAMQKNDPRVVAPTTKVGFVCRSPLISDVNKQTKSVIFSPGQRTYVIAGCFFGTQPGHVYLIGKFNAQQVSLQPEYWSDSEIDARVDPKTSGELDQEYVSIVVAPVSGPQIKASGFKFIAARSAPVFLSSLPKTWLKYSGWNGKWHPPTQLYVSPVPADISVKAARGASAYMQRSYNDLFSTGSDTYEPQLAPGWGFDSVQLITLSVPPSCPGIVTYKHLSGTAFAELTAAQMDWTHIPLSGAKVLGATGTCSGFIPIAPPLVYWSYSNYTGSAYALKVWARGPRCTDPYTGKVVQACMQSMKQCGQERCGM